MQQNKTFSRKSFYKFFFRKKFFINFFLKYKVFFFFRLSLSVLFFSKKNSINKQQKQQKNRLSVIKRTLFDIILLVNIVYIFNEKIENRTTKKTTKTTKQQKQQNNKRRFFFNKNNIKIFL